MDDVDALESHAHRLLHRQVQLVGGDNAQVGVLVLPPELVADHRHPHGVGGLAVEVEQDLEREPAHDQQDEGGHDRPAHLEAGVAVDLDGLGPVVAVAVAQDHVEDAELDEHEEERRDPEDAHEEVVDAAGRLPRRLQRVLGRVLGAGRRQEAHGHDQGHHQASSRAPSSHQGAHTCNSVAERPITPHTPNRRCNVPSRRARLSCPVTWSTMRPVGEMKTVVGVPNRR